MYKLQTRLPWGLDTPSTSGTGDVGGLVTKLSKECSRNRSMLNSIQSLQRDLDYSPQQKQRERKSKKKAPLQRKKAALSRKKKRRHNYSESSSESSSATSESYESSSSTSSTKSSKPKRGSTSIPYYSSSGKQGVFVPRERGKARSY